MCQAFKELHELVLQDNKVDNKRSSKSCLLQKLNVKIDIPLRGLRVIASIISFNSRIPENATYMEATQPELPVWLGGEDGCLLLATLFFSLMVIEFLPLVLAGIMGNLLETTLSAVV